MHQSVNAFLKTVLYIFKKNSPHNFDVRFLCKLVGADVGINV